MVESRDDLFSHNLIQPTEFHTSTSLRLHPVPYGYQHHIVMAMSIRIIALPKHSQVFLG
jgi:hypothetical protein